MAKEFEGRVAMVTGAAGGIGRASALAFARRGAAVALCDVGDVSGTASLVEAEGSKALSLAFDVTNSQSVRDGVEQIVARFGRLDFAHNNAGTAAFSPVAELADEDWARVIGVNLSGVFYCMKHQLPHLLETGGAIVNTASVWSLSANASNCAYVASKHGLVGLTRAAAVDYGRRGVRINAVAPGPIATPMTDPVPAPVLQSIVDRTTMGRIGQPGEIGEAVAWLCSAAAAYVNGVVLPVDGGYAVT